MFAFAWEVRGFQADGLDERVGIVDDALVKAVKLGSSPRKVGSGGLQAGGCSRTRTAVSTAARKVNDMAASRWSAHPGSAEPGPQSP
jgi:hypothetical protein